MQQNFHLGHTEVLDGQFLFKKSAKKQKKTSVCLDTDSRAVSSNTICAENHLTGL